MREEARSKSLEILEVLSVGLPFCAFKILAGLSLGGPGAGPTGLLASFLIGLGLLDGLINAANLAGLAFRGQRPMDACFFALATRPLRRPPRPPAAWQDLGNSLDILLSFALVAWMIGGGRLGGLSAGRLAVWNVCVILNVLGAGLGRFGESVRNLSGSAA